MHRHWSGSVDGGARGGEHIPLLLDSYGSTTQLTQVRITNSIFRLWLAGPYLAIWGGLLALRNVWVAVFAFHAVMITALCVHRRRWDIRSMWRGGSIGWLPALIVSSVACGWSIVFLAAQYPGYDRHLAELLRNMGLSGSATVLLAIYFCIFNPVIEEAFWRGLYCDPCRRLALSDFAYGGVHILILHPFMLPHQAWIAAAFLTLLGYLWRQLAIRRGGLALPIIWHTFGDAAVLMAVGRILQGTGT